MKHTLEEHLFQKGMHTLAILDGASVPDLPIRLYEMDPPNYCLFTGELEPDLQYAAPYLVYLFRNSDFTNWLLSECWGKHWGIFAQSRHSLGNMRRHFRSLVRVYDEDGKPMIFRFYDPRVLTSFLPTCNPGELKTVFGQIDTYFAEDAEAQSLVSFSLEDGALERKEFGAEKE